MHGQQNIKFSTRNIHENPSRRRRVVPCEQTVLFCNFIVKIIIKFLRKQYTHWIVRGIYHLNARANCEVYFLRRRPCLFITLAIGIYKGIGSVILISILYRCTDISI
jgi:hypothetical protein